MFIPNMLHFAGNLQTLSGKLSPIRSFLTGIFVVHSFIVILHQRRQRKTAQKGLQIRLITNTCRSCCYLPTCTGSMWQIESGTSSPSQSTDVCITRRQSTWQTAVSLSRISLVVRDCAQHTVASWTYRAINEQHSTARRSLSLDQPSGIRFQTS